MGFYENKIFPILLEKQMDKANYRHERNEALRDVSGDILEIGFGTGLNLPHYPKHIKKIVALDINPGMNSKSRKRMLASGINVDYHCLNSETLPFEASSFDSVVSTWTLCSIVDLKSALLEIHRVLKPTGKFLFLEHGLAGFKMQKLQNWLTPVQKIIGCGCHLNREIDEFIQQTGFKFENLDRFIMDGTSTPLASSMYRGTAIPLDTNSL